MSHRGLSAAEAAPCRALDDDAPHGRGSGRLPVKGVRVRITGGAKLRGFRATTKRSNAHGKIAVKIKPKTKGVLYFEPIVKRPGLACGAKVGVIGVPTPPVTG